MFATALRHRLITVAAGAALACVSAIGLYTWQADAAPGDDDTTFVPITPCRVVDTRPNFRVNTFGALSAADTITVAARGTNGNCTLPTDAVGLSLNVTAVNPTQPTFLTIWPGGPLPNASSLNPFPGSPPTPNAVVTDLSDTGTFNVYNLDGVVEVIIDVNGYHTNTSLRDLHHRVATLEARVAELEGVTASMTATTIDGQPTVRFSGVNVQIVDGSGNTRGDVNGMGNLVIGYNENDGADTRTGSHNLVVGRYHTYTSYGGLVAGFDNKITAPSSSVAGGSRNAAIGMSSSVSGGFLNTASGDSASVTGGRDNTASRVSSSVTGGRDNTASGDWASVTGGRDNTANNDYASVTSGGENIANAVYASVTGGRDNTARAAYTSVAGGDNISCSLAERGVCAEGFMLAID